MVKGRWSAAGAQSLHLAESLSRCMGHSYVGREHLLWALFSTEEAETRRLFAPLGIDGETLCRTLETQVGRGARLAGRRPLSPGLVRVLAVGMEEARAAGRRAVTPRDLLCGLLQEREGAVATLIRQRGAEPAGLCRRLCASFGGGESPAPGRPRGERQGGTAESKLLTQYTRDLLAQAREGAFDPLTGREEELARTIQILLRRSKNNPILLGEPGVGKTAIAEGLAQRMAAGQVPEALKNRRFLALDMASLVAGTKYRGEFEERLKQLLAQARQEGDILFFLDEVHTLVGAGSAEGAIDAANILKPPLARGEIQLIGATTWEEYRRHLEKDSALERRFQPVDVPEPDAERCLAILRRLKSRYELHHGLKIRADALEAAVTLSQRYLPLRRLPDKAIDLLDEAASRLRLEREGWQAADTPLARRVLDARGEKQAALRRGDYVTAARFQAAETDFRRALQSQTPRAARAAAPAGEVTRETVAQVLSQWTKIPVTAVAQAEGETLLHLEETLSRQVVGQQAAVSALARAVRRGRLQLSHPGRPLGSFLFLGPSGVGKTELCRALARTLFHREEALLRFDMTEYAQPAAVSRLLGAPPGYVGFEQGGQLTEAVRRAPYSVVLFDELEKAHSEIWALLLQVMEEGELTDAQGRKTDFRHAVLVMTSNVGAKKLSQGALRLGFCAPQAGVGASALPEAVAGELRAVFPPEFLNRLDEVLLFAPLGGQERCAVAEKLLQELARRVQPLGLSLRFGAEVAAYLAEKGFDPAYGARPLRRLIAREVEDPLALLLLEGRCAAGDTVCLAKDDDGLVLTPLHEGAALV